MKTFNGLKKMQYLIGQAIEVLCVLYIMFTLLHAATWFFKNTVFTFENEKLIVGFTIFLTHSIENNQFYKDYSPLILEIISNG